MPSIQRLVEERGLPPSRLMLQQAAAVSTSEPSPGQTEKQFKCDQCEFTSESQRGFKVHMGRRHKDLQLPENLRDGEREQFLAVSPLKEVREELPMEERSLGLCTNCDQELRSDGTCCESDKQLCEGCCFELKVCKLYSFVGLCKDCDAELRPFSIGCCERTKQLCEDCCDMPHG